MKNKLIPEQIEIYLKAALVFLIIYACFQIFKPFLLPVIWGIIIAVAIFPLHSGLTGRLKNRAGLSATLITLLLLAIIVIPSALFTQSLIENVKDLASQFRMGTFTISPPPENVAGWPVIGKPVNDIWQLFSDNMSEGVEQYMPQIQKTGEWLLSKLSGIASSLLVFILAIVIAGIFLSKSPKGYGMVSRIFALLVGDKGSEFEQNSKATIRSVVNGVLGTAVIQTTILAVSFYVFKVPFAGILSLIVLFCAIAQLPTILVVLPAIIYMFSETTGFGPVVFAIWGILGSLSDNFIKPMLLGRGMKIPMIVILIGSIGGMMLMGIIGLFIGAVVMALGYQLFQIWIEINEQRQ